VVACPTIFILLFDSLHFFLLSSPIIIIINPKLFDMLRMIQLSKPNINIKWATENARSSTDQVCIVADILRGSTTITTALAEGASYIIPVVEVSDAFKIKKQREKALLAGERNNAVIDGFDIGNSPVQLKNYAIKEREIIFTSTNFSKALSYCQSSPYVFIGSFLNIKQVTKTAYDIANKFGFDVCYFLAGASGDKHSKEDSAFAGVSIQIIQHKCLLDDRAMELMNMIIDIDIQSYLKSTKHAIELIEMGFYKDVEFAAKMNI
jgi:2-phosphosulfolactate phosphatase